MLNVTSSAGDAVPASSTFYATLAGTASAVLWDPCEATAAARSSGVNLVAGLIDATSNDLVVTGEGAENMLGALSAAVAPAELSEAEANPKKKMAMVFRWYFIHTNRLALDGDPAHKSNFQIHCGPAMAACNAWLRGTTMESWRARHVDVLADRLMQDAASHLQERLSLWTRHGDAGAPARAAIGAER